MAKMKIGEAASILAANVLQDIHESCWRADDKAKAQAIADALTRVLGVKYVLAEGTLGGWCVVRLWPNLD